MRTRLPRRCHGTLAAASLPLLIAPWLAAPAAAQIGSTPRPIAIDPRPTLVLDHDRNGRDELISYGGTTQGLAAYRLAADGTMVLDRLLSVDHRKPLDIAVADMDGDGLDDLVSIETENTSGNPFLGPTLGLYYDRGGPALLFQPTNRQVEPDDRITAFDFDGDGDQDIVLYPNLQRSTATSLPTPGTIRWWENLGNGGFGYPAPPQSFPEPLLSAQPIALPQSQELNFVALRPSSGTIVILRKVGLVLQIEAQLTSLAGYSDLEVGDVNGDGIEDVMALRGGTLISPQVSVDLYLGTASGALGSPISVLAFADGFMTDLSLLDADGDSDLDLALTTVGTSSTVHRIALLSGDGLGSFGPLRYTGQGRGAARTKGLAGDFDGDGRGDLLHEVVLASGPASMTRQGTQDASGAAFEAGIARGLSGPGLETLVCDFDGDGVNDIVLPGPSRLDGWLRGRADSSGFESPRPLDATGRGLLAANLDGDTAEEILVTRSPSSVWILDSTGNGGFGSDVLLDQGSAELNVETLAAVDLDGDGDLDLTATDRVTQDLTWFENTGSLVFAPGVGLGFDAFPQIRSFDFGDFDGDGRLDLLTSDFTLFPFQGDTYSWHQGLGGGLFGPNQPVGMGGNDTLVVDVDGDGADDVLWTGTPGTDLLGWTPGGPMGLGQSNGMTLVPSIGGLTLLGMADYDGDGRRDLLAQSTTAQVVGYRSLGAGASFSATGVEVIPVRPQPNNQSRHVRLADLGSDFDIDVLVESTDSGRVWYENTSNGLVGTSFCGPAVPNSTGQPSRILAAGSDEAQANTLRLRVLELPANAFGFFLASQTQVPATPVIASSGRICLGGAVGRYVGPGQVQSSGATGTFALDLDLSAIPQPNGFVAAIAGSSWSFQAWNRDTSAGGTTSNFSDGLEVNVR
ncbi:FG-GAP repeat protein [Planctomycetes bacterium Poly30]|uniref:FG-GAP repeat protein n=1 Tax=Saltatorellus ferox TaxID=2528018 RepID=A0A518F047_9BACT|nr:FG-GAP repeat protein [Planctomycetes bacterium Poly30]